MARLPNVGADANAWGALLNDFLLVAHRADGALRGVCSVINVRDFGAIGDGNSHPLAERYGALADAQAVYPAQSALALTDETDWAAIQAALDACVAAGGGEVCLPEGIYKLNRTLSATFTTNAHITLRGMKRAVLDMTSVPNSATQTLLTIGGATLGSPVLIGQANKGDQAITFDAAALAVNPGDVLLISAEELWDPWVQRPKGELVEAERADGASVTLRSPLFDSYKPKTWIQKLATPTVRVDDLEIKGDGPHIGLTVQYSRDVEVKGCRCAGARYAAFQLRYVFGGLFTNNVASDFLDPDQSAGAPALGVGYGLLISSCQYITTMGNRLFGGKHAIAHGYREPVRCIVHTGNILDNEHAFGPHQPCLDAHANGEFIEVTGNIILNGVTCNARNVAINHNLITAHGRPCIVIAPTQSGDYYRISNNQLLSDDYYGFWLAAQGDNVTIQSVLIGGNKIKVAAEGISIGVGLPPYDFTGLVLDHLELDGNDVVTTAGYALRLEGKDAKTVQINRLAVTGGRYRGGYNCFHTAMLTHAGHLLMRGVRLVTTRADGGPPVCLDSSDFADALIDGCWLESEAQPGYWNTLVASGDVKWINNVVKNFTKSNGLNLTGATLTFQNNTHYQCQGQLNLSGSGRVQGPRKDTGKVQTTTSANTPVWLYTLSENTVAEVSTSVLARDNNGNAATYKRRASVKRQQTGDATLIGAVESIGADKEDVVGWEVTIAVASNDVQVLVTGAGSAPIDWFADVEVTLFKP